MKLLEAQLQAHHRHARGSGDQSFLNAGKVASWDAMEALFFQVLAKRPAERSQRMQDTFGHVPYLNSSLFEPSALEHDVFMVSSLSDGEELPLLSKTVLRDHKGKTRSGTMPTLHYLLAFLDAYDFSSDNAGEEIQEQNKPLINASVLGLIFEKINGYKEGSFFTPGFITMYMCRETLRRAVCQRFSQHLGKPVENIQKLYELIDRDKKQEANALIDSMRICDPAVGSGHFLVSALNELIAIKSELRILLDREGRTLRDYEVQVVNDELIISTGHEEFFSYRPGQRESQRVQEALFHEKEKLIENCLFGVDINPNSVKICRLRLWIELLKNAYYTPDSGYKELETLPNIDINIKCGNSLVSRFALDEDLSKTLKKKKFSIDSYRVAVAAYRSAKTKEEKREMERLIEEIKGDFRTEISKRDPKILRRNKLQGELVLLTTQTDLFGLSKAEAKKRKAQTKKLTEQLQRLDQEIEEIKTNKLYENAFEWRFEFPEVLNDEGDFIGFDCVIGNPPYVFGGNSGITKSEKSLYKDQYETGSGKINLFALFIEKGNQILKSNGDFGFIIPNTFLRVTSYSLARKFYIREFQATIIYDFGDNVFEDAVTTAIVLIAIKRKIKNYEIKILKQDSENFINTKQIADNNFVIATNLKPKSLDLLNKIKNNNTTLGDITTEIIFGVVISGNKGQVVSNKPLPGYKPFLEGREIGKYFIEPVAQWINYNPSLLHRPRTKEVFEAPEKILIQRITGGKRPLKAALDNQKRYTKESINNIILKSENTFNAKFILAVINSALINWFYTTQFTNESNLTVNLSKTYLSTIPIEEPEKDINSRIIELVDNIHTKKEIGEKTISLEKQIDQLVYQLYDLTPEEIALVEESVGG
ncbi:Eco57I restriction-modification methylase domain-containing protein [Roseivirga sp. BDSF3-8]|uniref:type IIG restriction enzyme/methyltransferase n=1 Tax=Roseivirga sp. BDSF3-8 TaxID=3241598 RepID=UPI0035327AB3